MEDCDLTPGIDLWRNWERYVLKDIEEVNGHVHRIRQAKIYHSGIVNRALLEMSRRGYLDS